MRRGKDELFATIVLVLIRSDGTSVLSGYEQLAKYQGANISDSVNAYTGVDARFFYSNLSVSGSAEGGVGDLLTRALLLWTQIGPKHEGLIGEGGTTSFQPELAVRC